MKKKIVLYDFSYLQDNDPLCEHDERLFEPTAAQGREGRFVVDHLFIRNPPDDRGPRSSLTREENTLIMVYNARPILGL